MTRPLDGRRVFVTGASGIVGSWLVKELLASGASVTALIRDELPGSELLRSGDIERIARVRGSLEDVTLLERILFDYEPEIVFHLGAQTQVVTAQRHPLDCLEANVRGTYNLLEAARRVDPPLMGLVVASSDKAYGASDRLPYTEDHPLAGTGVYDVSKSAADLIAAAYARSYGLRLAIARCGNIYGGGDLNWDRIVPGTIRSLLRGERPVIRSDGRPLRDYIYVKDAVSAYLSLATAIIQGLKPGEAFNFGHGRPVSVLEIVDELTRILDRADLAPKILGTAQHEIPEQYLDASKAHRALGWQPKYGLHEGLVETVGWYREILAQ